LAAGILAPGLLVVFVAVLPYIADRQRIGEGIWFNRQGRLLQFLFALSLLLVVGLSVRGALR
jgi:hypothetical protein